MQSETEQPETEQHNYLDDVAPLPDDVAELAQQFLEDDDLEPTDGEAALIATELQAAGNRVKKARATLEENMALHRKRKLKP